MKTGYVSEREWREWVESVGGETIKSDRNSLSAYDKNGKNVASYNMRDPRWEVCTSSSGITIKSYARGACR